MFYVFNTNRINSKVQLISHMLGCQPQWHIIFLSDIQKTLDRIWFEFQIIRIVTQDILHNCEQKSIDMSEALDLIILKTLFNIVEERLKKLLNLDVCIV